MNIYDEWSRESLNALADEAKQKIAAKQRPDGKTCVWCTNFAPYAENNFGTIFLCYSCNSHVVRTILGLE